MAYLSKGFLTRFVNFVKSTRVNGYDTSKDRFKREATRILKEVAARMGLPKGSFEVRFNPAGPAVSGDPIFHSERVYANLSQFGEGFYYRSCAGRKDYTGGYNRWASWDCLLDLEDVARRFSEAAASPAKLIA